MPPIFGGFLFIRVFSPRVHSIPRGPHFNKLFAAKGGRLNLLCKLYFGFRQSYILTLSKLYFGLQPKLRYLSITCPKGKYHAEGISLSKTI